MLNSKTLSLYIFKLYCSYFLIISCIIFGIFFVGNLFDVLNSFKHTQISTSVIWRLVLYKTPYVYDYSAPLISFATMLFLLKRLTQHNELTIILCNGISIWRFLSLIGLIVVTFGLFIVIVVNPIGAYGLDKYERLYAKIKKQKQSDVTLLSSGVLVHEELNQEHRIIRAKSINLHQNELINVTILVFDNDNIFLKRIDADNALIRDGKFKFTNPRISGRADADGVEELEVITSLSLDNFKNILKDPERMSILSLRKTIGKLISYGLPVGAYQIYYYKQLLKPIIMLTTLGLASMFFSLTEHRHSRMKLLFSGLFVGFIFYSLLEIVVKMLSHYGVHPILAILLPNLLVLFISNFIILHLHEA